MSDRVGLEEKGRRSRRCRITGASRAEVAGHPTRVPSRASITKQAGWRIVQRAAGLTFSSPMVNVESFGKTTSYHLASMLLCRASLRQVDRIPYLRRWRSPRCVVVLCVMTMAARSRWSCRPAPAVCASRAAHPASTRMEVPSSRSSRIAALRRRGATITSYVAGSAGALASRRWSEVSSECMESSAVARRPRPAARRQRSVANRIQSPTYEHSSSKRRRLKAHPAWGTRTRRSILARVAPDDAIRSAQPPDIKTFGCFRS